MLSKIEKIDFSLKNFLKLKRLKSTYKAHTYTRRLKRGDSSVWECPSPSSVDSMGMGTMPLHHFSPFDHLIGGFLTLSLLHLPCQGRVIITLKASKGRNRARIIATTRVFSASVVDASTTAGLSAREEKED